MKLKDLISTEISTDFRAWGSTPFWRYYGEVGCSYLHNDVMTVLGLIGIHIYLMFPDRLDRALGLGDGSTRTEVSPASHPVGAHKLGKDQDFQYYTSGRNFTHRANIKQPKPTNIWVEDNKTLDFEKFDIKRNCELFEKIKLCFPKAQIMVSSGIKAALGLEFLYESDKGKYHHDLHAHVRMGDVIDLDAELCGFNLNRRSKMEG